MLSFAAFDSSIAGRGAEYAVSGYLSLEDGRTVPVHNGLVIGRVAGCDVVIDDTKASRRHVRIVVDAGVVEVEDLDSSNGTLLNGKPVTRRVLRDGDVVQIGKTRITYGQGVAGGAAPGKPADVFDLEDDLFGGAAPATPAAPVAPAKPVASAAPAAQRPAPPAAAAPPPPAPPPKTVIEFADEVVEVRKAAPERAAPADRGRSPVGEPAIAQKSRVLQFHKQEARGGLLGDDLAQMSGGSRLLVYAAVLAAAAGIVWLILRFMR